jgi:starch synthase (maltosyl-transferring)
MPLKYQFAAREPLAERWSKVMSDITASPRGPRIYNLFPLIAGPFPRWTPHLERARRMEFDWVFINPFHLTGFSASLYSIKDYYAMNPRLVDPAAGPPEAQLRRMIETARELGLKVMMDLVINHTAFDSPLVAEHPSWYKRGPGGKPVHPGAQEGDRRVTWGDLFEIDNSSDRDGLWRYWVNLAEYYAAMGVAGFRCDAAYKVPSELWRTLIGSVKRAHPHALFFAESLGCPFEDTVRLAQSGFDFIFNSSKWWDFTAPWCLEQYRLTSPIVPSVSFPESHDTERLAAELNGDRQAVKTRYAFAALFSTGLMMPIGFEYGFRRRLNVVKTRVEDWEAPAWDICDFVAAVNRLKVSRRVFNAEGPIDAIDLGNPNLFALVKWSKDRRERTSIILNKDRRNQQSFRTQHLGQFLAGTAGVEDLSPDGGLMHTDDFQACFVKPSGFHVLWAQGV